MHVVVTRERGHNDALIAWLPDDASVHEIPLTTTRFFDSSEVMNVLRDSQYFGQFRYLVVTSARSALYASLAKEALALDGAVLVVGTGTAHALEEESVDVGLIGEGGAADLAPAIDAGPVLLLGAAVMRDELERSLLARGVVVETLPCYETLPAELTGAEQATLRDADVVFIGAPSAWSVAEDIVSERTLVVVPGATTAAVVGRSHPRVLEGWGPELHEVLESL
ncbi:MAG TPA: uroporphyrinogen-III synthase [Acidimicrobiales bacterium]|jgi:uroporphyrinogen-III synthase|nr:uroporphyrinogen-III synthase [Acidimicrobiales bacterium]